MSHRHLWEHEAVIWDFDGTLTARPDMWCRSIAEACQIAGASHVVPELFDETAYLFLPWNREELSHPHAASADDWWSTFLSEVRPLILEHVDPKLVDIDAVLSMVRVLATNPCRFEILRASARVVDELAARGIPQYVLSNHVPELAEVVSQLFPGKFREVWSSGTLGFEKPRVEIFLYALRRLSVPSSAVLMVGDSYERDIEPAKLMGMHSMHVSELGEIQ